MSLYKIKIIPGQRRSFRTEILGGKEYGIDIRLNPLDSRFHMRIERNGKIVKAGAAVVPGVDLLSINPNAEQPAGSMYLYDLDMDNPKVGREPTLETFGDRILLVWDDGK